LNCFSREKQKTSFTNQDADPGFLHIFYGAEVSLQDRRPLDTEKPRNQEFQNSYSYFCSSGHRSSPKQIRRMMSLVVHWQVQASTKANIYNAMVLRHEVPRCLARDCVWHPQG
ncbi:hypothetical protein L9F63_011879, partial [Diploptera punctata]